MKILVYTQFNVSGSAKERMSDFMDEHNVPTPDIVTSKVKEVWYNLYHNTELGAMFITVPHISHNIEDIIVFAINRHVHVYLVTDYTELIKIKGLAATYKPDPNDKRNLVWTCTAHTRFYPNDLHKLILEGQAFQEALEDRVTIRKELVQMKHHLGIEFPSPASMLTQVRLEAEPFDIEIDYTKLPPKIRSSFKNEGSLNEKQWKYNGDYLTDGDLALDDENVEYYINHIAQMWLTIQYYKSEGLTPNPKEYVQCPECGTWHHRIRVEHCPFCDRENTEYREVLIKDFQVELESEDDIA